MKITAIKQQVKNLERASIFLDGKYSFSLGLNELIVEKLKIGLEIDEPELKRLKKKSDDGKLAMRALEWVLLRPHSVRELRDYLKRKKAEPDFTEELIAGFIKKKYLDDEYFARWWYERRVNKNKSNRAIASELMGKGISREIITDVLEAKGSGEDEQQRVQELIKKLRRRTRYADDEKLKAYLIRQGYSYSLVVEALKDA